MVKHSSTLASCALFISLCLCGCFQTAQQAPAPVASLPPSAKVPTNPGLPEGAPCTEAYVRYQRVLKADFDTGNVDKPVFDQIQSELARAATACLDGRDAEAQSIIRASQQKHGYHV